MTTQRLNLASNDNVPLHDQAWLLFAVLCAFSWGIWGILAGIAARHLHPVNAFEWHCVGFCLANLVAAALSCNLLIWDLEVLFASAAAGLGYGVGVLLMISAISFGYPAGLTVALTSMYPLGVFALNVFMKGLAISTWHVAGLTVGVFAICLLVEPWVQQDEEVASWTGLILCALSFGGYVTWVFPLEGMHEDMIIPSGMWQALGCSVVCLFARLFLLCTSRKDAEPFRSTSRKDAGGLQATYQLPLPYGSADSASSRDEAHTATGALAGFGSGVALAVGVWFFLLAQAFSENPTPAVMITSMYAVVTVILSTAYLGESLTLSKYAGVMLVLIACALVSFS